jgi:hypothetical protein
LKEFALKDEGAENDLDNNYSKKNTNEEMSIEKWIKIIK